MPIFERRRNEIELTIPRVLCDKPLSPRVKPPLPSCSGFCISVVGSAGSGKTSLMVSLMKSKDAYRKRFDNIITVIPSSSLASLKSNPFDALDDSQKFETLDRATIVEIIEMVEGYRDEDELTLLILDDVSASLQDMGILKQMMRLFLNRRHLNLSIISISHSLSGHGSLPFTVRKNISHLALFKPSSNIDTLNSEFLNLPKRKFRELIDYVYDKRHNFLLLETSTGALFKNFNAIYFGNEG